jgi:hypothetical protein
MQCIHVILRFSCLLTLRVLLYPLSHFQLVLMLFLSNLFVTHFLFRKSLSRLIGETTNVVRVTDLFFPFLSIPRVIVRGPYIHEDVGSPFFLPCLGVFSRPTFTGVLYFSADGALVDGCLAVFPRLKGRTNMYLFFLFDYLVALILKC